MPRPINNRLAIVLSVLLVAAAVPVTVFMLAPSDREAVIGALQDEAAPILAAGQRYPDLFPALVDSAAVDTPGPFAGIRFDRLGYFNGLSPDARTMRTAIGVYQVMEEDGGQSFTLIATGAEGIGVRWQGVTADSIPEPETR